MVSVEHNVAVLDQAGKKIADLLFVSRVTNSKKLFGEEPEIDFQLVEKRAAWSE